MNPIIFLPLILLFSINMQAQHCPFDGTHLIAIKIIDKHGKMIENANTAFYLVEVDNPMADSCTQAKGLLKKQFLIRDTFIAVTNKRFDRNGYNKQLNSRLTNAGVFANANMMLTLNQGENTCTLIGKSETVYTHYIYRQRKFEIVYTANNTEIKQAVPGDMIYALCTATKEIENFKPLIIRL